MVTGWAWRSGILGGSRPGGAVLLVRWRPGTLGLAWGAVLLVRWRRGTLGLAGGAVLLVRWRRGTLGLAWQKQLCARLPGQCSLAKMLISHLFMLLIF